MSTRKITTGGRRYILRPITDTRQSYPGSASKIIKLFSKIKTPIYLTHIHRQAGPCRRVSQTCISQICTHSGVYLVDVHLTYTSVHLSHKREPGRSIRYAPITYTPMRYTLMRYTPMRYTPMRCTPVR